MATKTINPQLSAYYEQLRHPMPDFLNDIGIHNIHDRANIRYNERLWQKVKELNEGNQEPTISEFRHIAAEIRRQIDIELYECDDPDRLSIEDICHRIWDAQIGISPVSMPSEATVADSDSEQGDESGDYNLAISISISVRGLSRREAKWIEYCFRDHNPDLSAGDHTIALLSTMGVDSIERIDRWLPKRIRTQLLGHISSSAQTDENDLTLPLKYRMKLFLRQIL
jgi:hypothetical protein